MAWVTSWDTWGGALAFLFQNSLVNIDMGPVKLTDDEPVVESWPDPVTKRTRISITFYVVPK